MKNTPEPKLAIRLDHIAVKTASPEKLFLFFTDILGLPVIWPVSKEPGFTTGGFFVGDTSVETLPLEKHGGQKNAHATTIAGLTFEAPPLDEIAEQLQRAGLKPTEPDQTICDYDGRQAKTWTSLCLEAISSPRHTVCLREYDKNYKGQLGKTISFTAPLGEIGLLGIKEITLESANPARTKTLWTTLLGCEPDADGVFKRDGMPLLRVNEGKEDGIAGLTLKVQSLDKARHFLKEKQLLGCSDKDFACITPQAVQGLRLCFSQ